MAEIGNIKHDSKGWEIFVYMYIHLCYTDIYIYIYCNNACFFRRSEESISILRIYHVNLGLLTWLEQKYVATIDASTHDLMPR